MKNIYTIVAALAAVFALSSCATKIVDADYPSQTIYITAAANGSVYTIDKVDTHIAQTPTPGATYRFLIDWDKATFTVPLSVYRAGIDTKGTIKVNLIEDSSIIDDMLIAGTLDESVEVVNKAFLEFPESVTIEEGSNLGKFNAVYDLTYLMANPGKKMAYAFRIECSSKINEKLSYLVVLIDTKVFDDPNLE